MRLVYKNTLRNVGLGDKLVKTNHEGLPEEYFVADVEPPRHRGSTGRVVVSLSDSTDTQRYYPGVFDLEWIERDD